MRYLHTIVCLAFLCFVLSDPSALAQDATDQRMTNSQFLAQEPRDQRIWVSASALTTAHLVAGRDQNAGRCIANWYFRDDERAFGEIIATMAAYPDREPSVIILAMADAKCGGINTPPQTTDQSPAPRP